MREKYFKNEWIEMFVENGILHAIYTSDIELSEEIARVLIEARHYTFTENGKTYPLLADVTKTKSFSKGAKKVFSSPEALRGLNSGAFLIKSNIEALLVNTWLSLYPPKLPTKLFSDKNKALSWLKNFKS